MLVCWRLIALLLPGGTSPYSPSGGNSRKVMYVKQDNTLVKYWPLLTYRQVMLLYSTHTLLFQIECHGGNQTRNEYLWWLINKWRVWRVQIQWCFKLSSTMKTTIAHVTSPHMRMHRAAYTITLSFIHDLFIIYWVAYLHIELKHIPYLLDVGTCSMFFNVCKISAMFLAFWRQNRSFSFMYHLLTHNF
jgi:hypothetical protein